MDTSKEYIKMCDCPECAEREDCIDPNCDNDGRTMPDGDMCEFCHREENSKFNCKCKGTGKITIQAKPEECEFVVKGKVK